MHSASFNDFRNYCWVSSVFLQFQDFWCIQFPPPCNCGQTWIPPDFISFRFFFPIRDESYILSILQDTEHSCEGWMKYNRQSIWEKMPGKRISSSMYRTDVIIDLGRKGLSFEIIWRWRADNSFNHVQACVSDKNLLSTSFLPPFTRKVREGCRILMEHPIASKSRPSE